MPDLCSELARAFDKMLVTDDERCVLIEAEGEKFVQVVVGYRRIGGKFDGDRTLILDVPCPAMSWDEAGRASKAFGSRGVEGPTESQAMFTSDGETATPGFLATYELDMGTDTEAAAETAVEVMSEIYELEEGRDVKVYCDDY